MNRLIVLMVAAVLLLATAVTARSRKEMMECAARWAKDKIPYCQCNGPAECCGHCPHCSDGYRCDCSGYVSYCLGLSHGYTTFTLPEVTHEISKDDLLPGDIMLCESEHVVFFAGWADGSKSNFVCYQEPGCHTAGPHYAFKSVVSYPFDWNPSCFKPYRLNGLDNFANMSSFADKETVREALLTPPSYPLKYEKMAKQAYELRREHFASKKKAL